MVQSGSESLNYPKLMFAYLIVAYLMFHTVVQRERGSLNFGECNMHYPQGEGQDSDRRSEEETSGPSPVEVGLLATNIRYRFLT